jgi:hypothetical protein
MAVDSLYAVVAYVGICPTDAKTVGKGKSVKKGNEIRNDQRTIDPRRNYKPERQ